MARLLDHVVVVDIESTCWEGKPPEGQENDIIEIGVCLLNVQTGERTKQEGILVVPQRSTVSEFCTELTTLTQEQVDRGVPFEDACRRLRKEYRTKERVWVSFGDYDRRQFERQCGDLEVGYPFGNTHINVKSLMAVMLGRHREQGMARALEEFGLQLEGTHHRGVDDAWNIAAIFWELLRRFRGNDYK